VLAYVTNFGGDGVSVVDPAKGLIVGHIKTGAKPHGVAITPDGATVFVSNEGDGTLSFIDPRSNTVMATVAVGDRPNQVAASADSRYAFVTLNGDDAVAIVDAGKHTIVKVVPVGRAPHIALRSPDGDIIYVTSEGDMKLVALDAHSWKVSSEIPLFGWPRVLTITHDGSRAYQTMRWLNGVLVVDLQQHKVVGRIAFAEPTFAPDGKDAHGPGLTPDGSELWLTTQTSNDVAVIEMRDQKLWGRIAVGHDPNWVDFTPDGRLAVISNTGSDNVSIVDVRLRKVVATAQVGKSPKRLAVGAVLTASEGSASRSNREEWNFDGDTVGRNAPGFTELTGKWRVAEDPSAPSGSRVLAQEAMSAGSVFNIALVDNVTFADVDVSVRLRAVAGRKDQGGGVVWRARDVRNYYVARYNPLENNFRVYFVRDGERHMLKSATVERYQSAWHTVRVTMKGNHIECYLDGLRSLDVHDGTFTSPGRAGLWTKADAQTRFDDFIVQAPTGSSR